MSTWMKRISMAPLFLLTTAAMAEETRSAAQDLPSAYRSVGLGLTAALTMAVCVLGAAYAVARIGAAAMGAAAEKPELLTRSLLFVALAEGLAVLGFAISMMILQKI
ncbi:ATP synthase subunit C [Holophaga foetida]|uniref:ATP synthase subunit C n=1 Tax=Holophaga foetida TaxID=35839 RepID=UPI0002472ABE|nr:ATP synthase subunit C [Holophaga foetida]